MQIPSVASQLQSQLLQPAKPQTPTQSPKPQSTAQVDADGDHDGDTSASDKGQAVDTKA
jgi:hypothetical protein